MERLGVVIERRACVLPWVLLAACFSEAANDVGSGGSESTAPCLVGTRGCDCGPAGECDSGLECHAPSSSCYEPGCDPGSIDCPCVAGECLGALACVDEFCVAPGTSSTTDGGGTSAATGESTQGPGPSTTGSGTAVDETTIMSEVATDPTANGSSTDAPVDECITCLMSVEICSCEACGALEACIYDGGDPMLCCLDNPNDHKAWNELVDCKIAEGCAAPCVDPPTCL